MVDISSKVINQFMKHFLREGPGQSEMSLHVGKDPDHTTWWKSVLHGCFVVRIWNMKNYFCLSQILLIKIALTKCCTYTHTYLYTDITFGMCRICTQLYQHTN